MLLAGRYEVLSLLGRGGMGVVVSAHDRTLGENVAIKLLRSELAGEPRWGERLAREAKLARQIHHPNVCRVFDYVQADGHVFVVMERALRTLRDELKVDAWRARPIEQRMTDVRAVTAGLAAIHQAGIVHRDVSAQNVLRLADGRLVVSDFGLAKDAADSTESVQGGTAAYMAPELTVGGGRATFATDIWALGIVMHEIVFGSRPTWRANNVARGIERPARRLAAEESGILDLCSACTAAPPRARPTPARTAAHLECVAGFRPRRRRRRAIATLAGVLVVGAMGWQAVRCCHSSSPHPPLLQGSENPIEITGTRTDWSSSSRLWRQSPDVRKPVRTRGVLLK